ncbi:hypothetical protein ACEW7V_00195 [Areca yellow leaf disease phytoplasma]|uniref:hypothetical protein n=1 Tax=Areca yellow leaf disease phytoplasma TaxID=927614 RepID=UPI0035B53BFF
MNDSLLKQKDEISEKNLLLQKELHDFSEKIEKLKNENLLCERKNNDLLAENIELKKEVTKLKPLVEKLTLSSNKLELILKEQ